MKKKLSESLSGTQKRACFVQKEIYKCRLCGEVYQSHRFDEGVSLLIGGDHIIHECPDGNFGKSEWIGHTPRIKAIYIWDVNEDDRYAGFKGHYIMEGEIGYEEIAEKSRIDILREAILGEGN